ncbi:cytidine deaminase-like protein [Cadophora sp. DSE1049]|nr:cytidine deaminase-like protein [Cadophora sp. DSE1049]
MGDMHAEVQDASEGGNDITFSTPVPGDVPSSKRGGIFVPLKTTLETRTREKIGKVYVTGVSAKLASTVLNLIRKLVPDDGGIDLQHLRRFAKSKDLPPHVYELLTNPPTSTSISTSASTSNPAPVPPELFLIAGPTSAISSVDLVTALTPLLPNISLLEVDVPLLSPTSQSQASTWTSKYWPTVYKKSNPFGPHPCIVERAEEEMSGEEEVESYMELAERVAGEAVEGGRGERVGAVVVERREGRGKVVAIAGDGRWDGWVRDGSGSGSGNVVAHAVMRVIGMVAGGLKAREDSQAAVEGMREEGLGSVVSRDGTGAESTGLSVVSSILNPQQADTSVSNQTTHPPEKPVSPTTLPGGLDATSKTGSEPQPTSNARADIFKDTPLSPFEAKHYDPSGNANGYLCHELEIYCTHEPCVMCSMAIVHSRFGRVVFKRRMPETGGLYADGELGHGLFWRKELNWTLLGWQWVCEGEGEGEEDVSPYLHA